MLDIEPPIWRRIQITDCTLDDLHECIQAAMGWENYHLHQFEIDGLRCGPPAPNDSDFGLEMEDETRMLLSEIVPKGGQRFHFVYEYDFGDGWRHELLFEGHPPPEKRREYPLCVEGERACPPEDVGRTYGYQEYLEAMADPKHEEHESFMEWGGPFDPEEFDAEAVTKKMRRER